jgi:hypothetical protein
MANGPIDRGYVVITDRGSAGVVIEVCLETDATGRGVNPYAVHTGVAAPEIVDPGSFRTAGNVSYSLAPQEVNPDAGALRIAPVGQTGLTASS